MDLLNQDIMFKNKNFLSTEGAESPLDRKTKPDENRENAEIFQSEAEKFKKDLESTNSVGGDLFANEKELNSLRESLKTLNHRP